MTQLLAFCSEHYIFVFLMALLICETLVVLVRGTSL